MRGYNSTIDIMGDKTHEWLKFVQKWKKQNPPLDNGCYVCGHCGRFVLAEEVTLGHIYSRSREPSRVFDPTNLQPEHASCNNWKGSRYFEPKVTQAQYDFLQWMSKM